MWLTEKHWPKTARPEEDSSGKDVAISKESGWSTLH